MQNNTDIIRCTWCGTDPLYQQYHDEEWGKPIKDDRTLFEFIVLESAQAGLSWITILRRREHYQKLFAHFDILKVSKYTDEDIGQLLQNPGIIRHRGKIEAAIKAAKIVLEIQKDYDSLYTYLYSFMPNNSPVINKFEHHAEIPSSTALSEEISKELRKKGLRFFGPTICYAYMQATGMVNDHVVSCSFR